jgi:hypothetical protein
VTSVPPGAQVVRGVCPHSWVHRQVLLEAGLTCALFIFKEYWEPLGVHNLGTHLSFMNHVPV